MANDFVFPLLSQALKALRATIVDASINIGEVPPTCRAGFSIKKNQAAQDILRIQYDIRRLLQLDAAALLLQGGNKEEQKKIQDIALEEGCIAIDGTDLYTQLTEITQRVLENNNKWKYTTSQALAWGMGNCAELTGISSFIAPNCDPLINREMDISKFYDTIKTLVRDANADEFNARWIERGVFEAVITQEYNLNIVPVIVVGLSDDEIDHMRSMLFGQKTAVAQTQELTSKDEVLAALKQLKPFFSRAMSLQKKLQNAK
jgi:hypothetical protein